MPKFKAILFDIDGTLYRQRPLRQRMLKELLLGCLQNPFKGYQELRVIYTFRKERERLRYKSGLGIPLEKVQYSLPAQKLGLPEQVVRNIVQKWIYQRPLKYLRACKIRGLDAFLKLCRSQGVTTGVLSDYPAREKLKALEILHLIDLILCTVDPEINAFKPSPKGLAVALEQFRLSPEEILYIGDRMQVDGKCAQALNIPFILMTSRLRKDIEVPQVRNYEELRSFIF